MCLDPATIAILTLAAQAGGAVMQHQAGQAQADAQDSANEQARKAFAQEEEMARLDVARQRQQEYEAAAEEANSYASAARREMASWEAMLGEAGGANGAGRRLATIGIDQGRNTATLATNATRAQAELGYSERAAAVNAQQKLTSLRAPDRPSLLATGLQIGSAALQYGGRMNDIKNPRTPLPPPRG